MKARSGIVRTAVDRDVARQPAHELDVDAPPARIVALGSAVVVLAALVELGRIGMRLGDDPADPGDPRRLRARVVEEAELPELHHA